MLMLAWPAHAQPPHDTPDAEDADPSAQPSPPAGDESSDELTPEELRALEEALEADLKEGADATQPPASDTTSTGFQSVVQSLNPDISFTTDVALGYFSSDTPLQTGAHDPRRTGFNLQQIELTASAAVDAYFRFNANIVFAQYGVEVEEAYATTLGLPWNLQVRAGQFLTRFGRINNTHPHAWEFLDQPLIIGRYFGGEGNRGLGVETSWLAPLPWYVELVGSVTDPAGEATARSFFGGNTLTVVSPLDFQFTGAVKQFFPFTDSLSLLWGLSAANGPNPSGHATRTDVYGTDFYLRFRPVPPGSPTVVTLTLEYLLRRTQIPDDLLQDHGGYASLFWKFAQRWGVAVRYEVGAPALNRSGATGADPLDPQWDRYRHRASANLTFWPTEFSRLRLQTGADWPRWLERPVYSLMLGFEVAVGAHGAHAF